MIRAVAIALGAAMLLGMGGVSTAQAQQGLDRRDRLMLFYYNYYIGQQNTKKLYNQQQDIERNLTRFEQSQNQRGLAGDPLDRFFREGRGAAGRTQDMDRRGDPTQGQPLPPIYSGGGGQRQYFNRINYFNPPRRN